MLYCGEKTIQIVPTRYHYKKVPATCGQTSHDGGIVMCEECEEKAEKTYPYGWREVPGDICKHGTYIGSAGGPDYMCGQCETGD